MPFVTVDDPITVVGPRSLVLAIVDIVDRAGFTVSDWPHALKHTDEGVRWVRGLQLPDAPDVQAARAAQALVELPSSMGLNAPGFGKALVGGGGGSGRVGFGGSISVNAPNTSFYPPFTSPRHR